MVCISGGVLSKRAETIRIIMKAKTTTKINYLELNRTEWIS
jgi:hypothetical protein